MKNPYGPNNRVILGVEVMIELYLALAAAMPDHLTVVEDCMGFVDPKTGDKNL